MQKGGTRQSRCAWLLSVLIIGRAVGAVVVFYSLIRDLGLLAMCVFALACVTDLLDGQIAKRTGISPSLGAYADPTADFLLTLGAFSAFVIKGVYPVWTVIAIVLMYLQFVLTSGRRGPLYDPIGKYYGALLFGAVGVTLLSDNPAVRNIVLAGVALYTGASAAGRCLYLIRRGKAAVSSR
jgi:CDP-diacylglycerol--glycerol-3-phosphate 3-phosphatidyltransferase